MPVYNWYPAALFKARSSSELLFHRLNEHIADKPSESASSLKAWINDTLVATGLGITDARAWELDSLVADPASAEMTFAAMISLRAHVGWSTHGHSAIDVNIYSSGGPGTEALRGNVENTDIGKFLRHYLDVDVDAITRELREKMSPQQLGIVEAQQRELGHATQDVGVEEGGKHWMRHDRPYGVGQLESPMGERRHDM